jgi:hypothetical protein
VPSYPDYLSIQSSDRTVWFAYGTPGWANITTGTVNMIMGMIPYGEAVSFKIVRPTVLPYKVKRSTGVPLLTQQLTSRDVLAIKNVNVEKFRDYVYRNDTHDPSRLIFLKYFKYNSENFMIWIKKNEEILGQHISEFLIRKFYYSIIRKIDELYDIFLLDYDMVKPNAEREKNIEEMLIKEPLLNNIIFKSSITNRYEFQVKRIHQYGRKKKIKPKFRDSDDMVNFFIQNHDWWVNPMKRKEFKLRAKDFITPNTGAYQREQLLQFVKNLPNHLNKQSIRTSLEKIYGWF